MTMPRNYAQEAASKDVVLRKSLAIDEATPPEVLYYLASDRVDDVREAVADNLATPLQAMPQLVHDPAPRVRAALARKISRILPKLEGNLMGSTVMDLLVDLAKDQAEIVQQQVAITLQDTAFLPAPLALALARCAARDVAGPVLRFCINLSDGDLVDLVKNALLPRSSRPWVVQEVAQRALVSEVVSEAVWETGQKEAVTLLLQNKGASFLPAVLDEMVDASTLDVALQGPLARRAELSPGQLARLAEFVDGGLLDSIASRIATDKGTLSDVHAVVRRRLEFGHWRKTCPAEAERARALFSKGELDFQAVSDAVAFGERAFVVEALSLLARVEGALVQKILDHQSPKGITALCFRAGLPMRTCRQIQLRIAKVPVLKALYAREGVDYPLSLEEMLWQLEFYGIGPSV